MILSNTNSWVRLQRIWGWNHLAKSWARRRPWEAWGILCVWYTGDIVVEVYISEKWKRVSNFGVSFFNNSIGRLSGSRVCAPCMNQWKAIRFHHWCGCWPAYFFLNTLKWPMMERQKFLFESSRQTLCASVYQTLFSNVGEGFKTSSSSCNCPLSPFLSFEKHPWVPLVFCGWLWWATNARFMSISHL